jgi:23S rRNA (cytidine2498-2'-O)-methyltransferase
MWMWTCRQGFEADLAEELARVGKRIAPRAAGPALVASDERPPTWPVFARAGFEVAAEVRADPEEAARAVAAALDRAFAGKPRAFALQWWVPDADATNQLSGAAQSLGERTLAALERLRPDHAARRVDHADEAVRYGGWLAQLCLVAPDRLLAGTLPGGEAPTLAPGGRDRSRMPRDAPSRAGRKLVEAFSWIGRAPEAGETCVDLGAAPGGWTAVLLERRARVVAVDPAELAPELRKRKGVAHVKASAFEFAPDEAVDWLFCDMAWRPLEVASLLARWGKRRWAQTLVANVKLPMKMRVEFVERVLKIVGEGGWQDLRARQLYHDREEVTITGWRT